MDRADGLSRARLAAVAAAWLAFAGYAAILFRNASQAVGGSDSSGYVNAARLLASGRVSTPILPPDLLGIPPAFDHVFIPLAFVPGPEPRTMTPFYPVGFPLHVAAVSRAIGWEKGPYLASPLLALGSVLLLFLVARELGLRSGYALAGAALLAACAVFLYQALQPMSDVAATFWALAAVLASLRARRKASWSLAAGAAFGMAVLIRPTNVLLLPALLFALPWRRKSLALFAAGGMPMAVAFGFYNRAAYGHPLRTGWGVTGHLEGFGWSFFPGRVAFYASWLSKLLTPLVPVAWLALPAIPWIKWRDRAVLFLWFGAYLLFYCFFEVYGTWWYTRFLLPGIPALILAFLLFLREAEKRWRLRPAIGAVLVIAVLGWTCVGADRLRVLKVDERQAVIPRTCAWVAAQLPEKALVVSMDMSGALRYYTGRIPARWDRTTPETFAQLRVLAENAGYRWYALLLREEVKAAEPRLPAPWRFIGERGAISLWHLEPAASAATSR
ncbi:MAG: glycosyltransferase family 39 protein [Thermoanaerobaculia bacterium]